MRTSGGRPQPEPTSSYALQLIVSGPCWWSERMVLLSRRFKMSLFFNTSLSYGRQTGCSATRLPLHCSRETVTSRGPATSLAGCVLGPARRCECSDVAWMAYRACANDGLSVARSRARARNLRGGEGVKRRRRGRLAPRAHAGSWTMRANRVHILLLPLRGVFYK